MKLVICNSAWVPYADEFARRLGLTWKVESNHGDESWLAIKISRADALLATGLPPRLLPAARDLRLFLYPGAGVRETDPAAYPAGCRVVNVYEHEGPIAEYVLAAMLLHCTGIQSHAAALRRGDWVGSGHLGGEPHDELAGKTVSLFGYGHIGKAIARRARALGMQVIAVSRRNPDDLPAMLSAADFLVIAAPLTAETRGRFGAAELASLRPAAYLINVARAEIVDEAALYEVLLQRRIAGAALDVWYQYPQEGQVGHGSRLPFHQLSNVLPTPHASAWTRAMIDRRIQAMTDNLQRLERGEALKRVVLIGKFKP